MQKPGDILAEMSDKALTDRLTALGFVSYDESLADGLAAIQETVANIGTPFPTIGGADDSGPASR